MKSRNRLLLDVVMLLAFLAASYPFVTGISIHEWLSLALLVAALVHVALNWEWVERVSDRILERLKTVSRLDFIIDALLFVSFVAVSVSGLLISQVILSLAGIAPSSNAAWSAVHAISARATMALLGTHFVLHWRWMLGVAKRTLAPSKNGVLPCPE